MKKQTIAYLVGLAMILLGIYLVWPYKAPTPDKGGIAFVAAKGTVTAFTLGDVNIFLQDNKWIANGDIALDKAKVDAIVAELCPLSFEKYVGKMVREEYGLLNSKFVIKIQLADGGSGCFSIGNTVSGGSGYYLKNELSEEIYIIRTDKAIKLIDRKSTRLNSSH